MEWVVRQSLTFFSYNRLQEAGRPEAVALSQPVVEDLRPVLGPQGDPVEADPPHLEADVQLVVKVGPLLPSVPVPEDLFRDAERAC